MIKWLRLKRICEELCGRIVRIHSSTELSDDQVAGVEFNNDEVNIILNMRLTKSESMIIRALAHEMLHVINNNNSHNIDFDEKWNDLEEKIRMEYEK